MKIIKIEVVQGIRNDMDKVILITDYPAPTNIDNKLELSFYATNGCDYADIYFPDVPVKVITKI